MSTAKVVFLSADSACGLGVCPTGCSHMMWICTLCSCEGGWGCSPEKLEEYAANHICPVFETEAVTE